MRTRHGLAAWLAAFVLPLTACGGDGADGAADGDAELGREVFTSIADPSCGSCHTLADAGTTGTIAPNLDELQPSADQVEQAVRAGPGAMPSFENELSSEQIDAVSTYVANATGS